MEKKFTEYEKLQLPKIADEVLTQWERNEIFKKSVESRPLGKSYVFYEGPPSANGLPGIHHAMGRTIKDIFCRYKTLKGYRVERKAGWDTHGLPVELSVEKELGITKEDIGKTISIEDYNKKCRENVMKYTNIWNDLTRKMGYWVDMEDPYVTYENKYIESVWNLLYKLYDKGLLYKGYTIQPYSPKAGTGLSTHELNQPGTYRDVKDTTIVAQFKVVKNEHSSFLFDNQHGDLFFLAWTTTPWTLPSNSALAVGPKIDYVAVKTFNQYTHQPVTVVLAENLMAQYFPVQNAELSLSDYQEGDKKIPYEIAGKFKGAELTGIAYEQLLPYVQPLENEDQAFHVIEGDFVTTEDGTGIVHIAPTFGADDARVAKAAGVPAIMIENEAGEQLPLVDLHGRFVAQMGELGGEYVKEEYFAEGEKPENYLNVDVRIAIKLKEENRAFRVAKYEHSYPHCWRTDKPVLYYPLDSWFVNTTKVKERLIELNNTINWKPASTGTGRFGNWLENLQDWNLSRSRYWGIPIPIWTTEDRKEQICIGSMAQLKEECEKAVKAGLMASNPLAAFSPDDFSDDNYNIFDLHRPYVDDIVLASASGQPMRRESDLIDVWFDSGSMPYAQWHYPFENKALFERMYPADFIAEGVDQTRGWFFTLHAIATMCFDQVAFKNVVSNGLVLDKNGQKMSKRLGNAVDPFTTLENYGPDATRWYMISNAQPWDNLKFDLDGITEVQRKFFGTLYNTYGFLALYGNVDGFHHAEADIPLEQRPEIDRWIISRLNTMIKAVDTHYGEFEPTKAARYIQQFVNDDLSNWYVRLCRRRFWKGSYSEDKISAYQTLYHCLDVVARLAAPIAPFYMDRLFNDLNEVTGKHNVESVHLAGFPESDPAMIDQDLEAKMDLAQRLSSLVLSLRKKEKIKVRQPLHKLMVPVLNSTFKKHLEEVSDLVLAEVNVKELEYLEDTSGILVKRIKPNFKALGPRYGKIMKGIAKYVGEMSQEDIVAFEQQGLWTFQLDGQEVTLEAGDAEITSDDIPGWLVASDDKITVALDITLTEDLKQEGLAREFVNRIQNIRKDEGLEVTDKINLTIIKHEKINNAINNNKEYICAETLADHLNLVDQMPDTKSVPVEIEQGVETSILIEKV